MTFYTTEGKSGEASVSVGEREAESRPAYPQVKARKDRPGCPWVFRYPVEQRRPDGTVRTIRRYREVGPSKGKGALSRKQAEAARDRLLGFDQPVSPDPSPGHDGGDIAPVPSAPGPSTALPFGRLARLYVSGYLRRRNHVAEPTRQKEEFYIREYLIPRWGIEPAAEIRPQAVEDWLHTAFDSWWTMHGVRGIMNRIFRHAEGHRLWPEGQPNPASKARLGKKRHKRERRILSFDETARVLARLDHPYRLIIQICIATGARISEVLGLTWKHVDLQAATIRIDQRVWHQEVGRPKSENSLRLLGIGDLAAQFRSKFVSDAPAPESFVFQQKRAPGKPLWDSGVRDALHQSAQAEGCDFPGLGPHSFRRANITWRQQVGGSAIEASRIAGHSALSMTSEYTFVTPERQNELTRRIQKRLIIAVAPPTSVSD